MPAKRQLCVDCEHFRRCFELVPELRGDEGECWWDPSRFSRTGSGWDRASHRALAVGRGGAAMGELLNMRERGRPFHAKRVTGRGRGDGRQFLKKRGARGGPG